MPRGKRTRWPVDVGAGAAEDLGRLGEVDDLDADLLEEGVGVGLDLLEALGRDDLDRRQLPGQVRQRVHGPGEALALSRGPTAPHGGVFEVRDSHRISSGFASAEGAARHRHGTAARIRGGVPAPGPRRRRGSRGAARRRRRSGGTGCRARSRPSARAVSATGVSAMTRVSASSCRQLAGQRRPDGRHAVLPAEDDRRRRSTGRRPPRSACAAGRRRRCGRGRRRRPAAAVTIVTSWPRLGEVDGGPETAPVVEVVEDEDAATRDGRAVEHVVDREHVRAVHAGEPVDQRQRPLEPRPRRPRPGRHDDLVGGDSSATQSAVASDAEPDVHAERLEPPPNHASRSVIWPRDGWSPASRNWPPRTGPRSTSVTRWPRSAATRAASSPAGPPPTTRTRRGSAGRLEPVAAPLPLAPGRRVDEARDPVVARATAPAQLVARDARPDLVRAPGAGLGDQVRIGDLAADDADHVGMTGGQDRLGGGRRPDVALGLDQRVTDDRLERRGERLARAAARTATSG